MSYSLVQLFLLLSRCLDREMQNSIFTSWLKYTNMSGKLSQSSILLVDDSSTNIALLEAIFDEKGYHIIKAQSVTDAITSINRKIPDLILLDLLFPKVSGFDFFKQLQENEQTRNIPVIIISALSDEESENRAMELGAVDYINKPIDIQYLISKVESILKP